MAQPKFRSPCIAYPRHFLKALLLGFLGLALLAGALPRNAVAHRDEGVVKVVYHADFADPRRFSAMLTSINNMVTTYKNDLIDYDIRIVFVAHGIRFVTDDKLVDTPFAEDPALAERRDNLKGRLLSLHKVHGVGLELCDITRSQINLPKDKVYKGVEMVPSGVVRIAELQRDNFAYIKIE
jgi:intracellular sulfur oxidation DsrE/DsrF family protein